MYTQQHKSELNTIVRWFLCRGRFYHVNVKFTTYLTDRCPTIPEIRQLLRRLTTSDKL